MAFSTIFVSIKIYLSGNTVWPKASSFQEPFLAFLTFVSKYKKSSLFSQCWMRLFSKFSNIVFCGQETRIICHFFRMIQWMNESHSRAFYVCLTLNLPFSLKSLGRSNIDLETEPSPFLFQFLCCFCGKSGRAEAIARSSNLLTSIDESRKVTIHQWLPSLLLSKKMELHIV